MIEKYKNLIEYSKKLEVLKFEEEFDNLLDNGDDIDICLLSKVLENYPEVSSSNHITEEILKIREKNLEKINQIIDIIISESFVFDRSLLFKKHDEVIKFSKIYDMIGWDYSDFITGNTILHSQVAGLHIEGVKFISEKERKLIYCGMDKLNSKGNTPIESLFLEHHNSFEDKNALEKKEIIFNILTDFADDSKSCFLKKLMLKVAQHQVKNKKINIDDFNRKKYIKNHNIDLILSRVEVEDSREKRHLNILSKLLKSD